MNKSQLKVAWIIGSLIALSILFPPQSPINDSSSMPTGGIEWHFIGNAGGLHFQGSAALAHLNPAHLYISIPVLVMETFVLLLVAGLLIYTLRSKKE